PRPGPRPAGVARRRRHPRPAETLLARPTPAARCLAVARLARLRPCRLPVTEITAPGSLVQCLSRPPYPSGAERSVAEPQYSAADARRGSGHGRWTGIENRRVGRSLRWS